jgi:hypothetical protein
VAAVVDDRIPESDVHQVDPFGWGGEEGRRLSIGIGVDDQLDTAPPTHANHFGQPTGMLARADDHHTAQAQRSTGQVAGQAVPARRLGRGLEGW